MSVSYTHLIVIHLGLIALNQKGFSGLSPGHTVGFIIDQHNAVFFLKKNVDNPLYQNMFALFQLRIDLFDRNPHNKGPLPEKTSRFKRPGHPLSQTGPAEVKHPFRRY